MSVPSVSIQELKNLTSTGDNEVVLLDVRTVGENTSVKIADTVLIPLNELAGRACELDKEKKIFVYCATGNRSQMACNILQQEGFENCFDVRGGIHAWQREGYDVEHGENKKSPFVGLFGF